MTRKVIIEPDSGEGHFIKAERFAKTMTEVWRHVCKREIFTTAEEKTLHRLAMYLQLNTNAIVTPRGDYMNIERMAEETNIDRSNIRKVIKELIKKNAIGMWKSGDYEIYYMNPFLYEMGNVPPFLFNQFDEEYHRRVQIEHNLFKVKAGKKITSILVARGKNVKQNQEKKTEAKAV